MATIQLCADLANLRKKGLTLESAKAFLERLEIGSQPALGYGGVRLRGHEETIFFDKEEMENAIATSQNHKSSFIYIKNNRPSVATCKEVDDCFVMADDPIIKGAILHTLQEESKNAERFLDACHKGGEVPLHIINGFFGNIQKYNSILRFSGTAEHPTLSIIPIPFQYATLEDELETKVFLAPFLAGEGPKWIRNRRCEECGNIFFYKQDRARFCSQICRIRANNKARREK